MTTSKNAVNSVGARAAGNSLVWNGTDWIPGAPGGASAIVVPGLRPTLESGVPVSSTEQRDKAMLFYTPYTSGLISTLDAGVWTPHITPEISISLLLLPASTVYDVFAYWDGAAMQLELSAAWVGNVRTDAIVRVDGVRVKSADHSRLWVATITTTAAGQHCSDAAGSVLGGPGGERGVWSVYNQVRREAHYLTSSVSWPVASAGQWQARTGAAGQSFLYVCGDASQTLEADVACMLDTNAPGGDFGMVGVGIDTANVNSVNSAQRYGSVTGPLPARANATAYYRGAPGAGRHEVTWIERSSTASTTTFYGISGAAPAPISDNWTGAGLSGFLMM